MAEGTVKTIDQLPTKQNILGTDFIPLDDGMQSYKTTWAALLALTGGIASASISGNTITITTQGGQTYTLTPSDSTKQDVLTFDLVPTNGSTNPVTSDGIYDAVHDVSVALAGETSRATAAEAAIPAAIANRNYYGTCATSASTAEKEVTILDTTFSLVVGAEIYVKFTHTNTATNPTIKVNDTAAKSVFYSTAAITTSDLDKAGYADRYEKYVYDGTYWVWAGWSVGSNTGVPDGGTTGQALVKHSNTNGDAEWKTPKDMSGLEDSTYHAAVGGTSPSISDPYIRQSDVDDTLNISSTNPIQNGAVKAAVDEIKANFQWKTLGSVTGKTESISLPSSYNELYVWGVDAQTSVIMGGLIPNGVTGNQIVINGHYISSAYSAQLGVKVTSSAIKMNECYVNGTERSSTTTITVLYR